MKRLGFMALGFLGLDDVNAMKRLLTQRQQFGSYLPLTPRYLLYRALGALVPYIVGTWGVRVLQGKIS